MHLSIALEAFMIVWVLRLQSLTGRIGSRRS
jgi:hypothetical protein